MDRYKPSGAKDAETAFMAETDGYPSLHDPRVVQAAWRLVSGGDFGDRQVRRRLAKVVAEVGNGPEYHAEVFYEVDLVRLVSYERHGPNRLVVRFVQGGEGPEMTFASE